MNRLPAFFERTRFSSAKCYYRRTQQQSHSKPSFTKQKTTSVVHQVRCIVCDVFQCKNKNHGFVEPSPNTATRFCEANGISSALLRGIAKPGEAQVGAVANLLLLFVWIGKFGDNGYTVLDQNHV